MQIKQFFKKSINLIKCIEIDTYLLLLLIEIVNYDSNEEVQSEKSSKYNENNKIYIHFQVDFILWLFIQLE